VEGAASPPPPPPETPAQLGGTVVAGIAKRKRGELSSWCETS
jgi:hypothetical protein